MEKLISTDALEGGKFHSIEDWTPVEYSSWQRGWNDAIDAIISNVSTVDAPEVVRCKDCRFFEDEDEYGNCYCNEWGNVTNANGYCHDAERKEKMSKNNNSTYLCDEYQDLIEIRRWCAIFGAVQLVSLILFAIACAL